MIVFTSAHSRHRTSSWLYMSRLTVVKVGWVAVELLSVTEWPRETFCKRFGVPDCINSSWNAVPILAGTLFRGASMTRLSLGFCATYSIHCQVCTSCSFIVYANDTRTRNRRRKQIPETGTINRHKTRASSYSLSKIGTRKIRHQIVRQMLQKPVPVFWNWFLAPISGTCVILLLSSQPSSRFLFY